MIRVRDYISIKRIDILKSLDIPMHHCMWVHIWKGFL